MAAVALGPLQSPPMVFETFFGRLCNLRVSRPATEAAACGPLPFAADGLRPFVEKPTHSTTSFSAAVGPTTTISGTSGTRADSRDGQFKPAGEALPTGSLHTLGSCDAGCHRESADHRAATAECRQESILEEVPPASQEEGGGDFDEFDGTFDVWPSFDIDDGCRPFDFVLPEGNAASNAPSNLDTLAMDSTPPETIDADALLGFPDGHEETPATSRAVEAGETRRAQRDDGGGLPCTRAPPVKCEPASTDESSRSIQQSKPRSGGGTSEASSAEKSKAAIAGSTENERCANYLKGITAISGCRPPHMTLSDRARKRKGKPTAPSCRAPQPLVTRKKNPKIVEITSATFDRVNGPHASRRPRLRAPAANRRSTNRKRRKGNDRRKRFRPCASGPSMRVALPHCPPPSPCRMPPLQQQKRLRWRVVSLLRVSKTPRFPFDPLKQPSAPSPAVAVAAAAEHRSASPLCRDEESKPARQTVNLVIHRLLGTGCALLPRRYSGRKLLAPLNALGRLANPSRWAPSAFRRRTHDRQNERTASTRPKAEPRGAAVCKLLNGRPVHTDANTQLTKRTDGRQMQHLHSQKQTQLGAEANSLLIRPTRKRPNEIKEEEEEEEEEEGEEGEGEGEGEEGDASDSETEDDISGFQDDDGYTDDEDDFNDDDDDEETTLYDVTTNNEESRSEDSGVTAVEEGADNTPSCDGASVVSESSARCESDELNKEAVGRSPQALASLQVGALKNNYDEALADGTSEYDKAEASSHSGRHGCADEAGHWGNLDSALQSTHQGLPATESVGASPALNRTRLEQHNCVSRSEEGGRPDQGKDHVGAHEDEREESHARGLKERPVVSPGPSLPSSYTNRAEAQGWRLATGLDRSRDHSPLVDRKNFHFNPQRTERTEN
eukprot:GHVT01075618.1.p1 GENE.GHVT01075618.1~~GHVT01075618.1.p1  ORF type:complete len:897 (-),score=191.71 GHVT01075618.1:868-3558(-)